jgi:hypothetical protein
MEFVSAFLLTQTFYLEFIRAFPLTKTFNLKIIRALFLLLPFQKQRTKQCFQRFAILRKIF